MILPFSTQLNGRPTYFVQKIWTSIREKYDIRSFMYETDSKYFKKEKVKPKRHTIREDKNNRWKPGVMIDFFINTRTKDMFRFAPRIPVVSTQKIQIIIDKHYYINDYQIFVDGRELKIEEKIKLAHNDGFDNLISFFLYFNTDFSGKIIHWTDLKY